MTLDLTSAVGRLLEDTYKEAYTAGLRRAQELAKETIESRHGGLGFAEFDQAIDAEAAKERT